MMDMILSAYTIGLLLAVAPGVITIATVQRSCAYGFRNAAVFNIGVTFSDVLFLILLYLGIHLVLEGNTMLNIVLLVLSGIWLGWMGLSSVSQQLQIEQFSKRDMGQSNWQSFCAGFVTNTVNPLTIIGWAAVAGTFFNQWAVNWPPVMPYGLLASALMLVGILSWQFVLITLACAVRKVIRPCFLKMLSVAGGVFLVIFSFIALKGAIELMIQVLA